MQHMTVANPDKRGTYRRLFSYLGAYRLRFAFAILAMVVYGMTEGVVPFLIKSVLDDIFGAQKREMLWILLVFLIGFSIVRGVFGFLQQYLTATVGLNIIRDLRNQINAKLLALSSSFFSRHSTGALIARMTNDTLLVRTALTDAVSAVLRDSVRVISLLGAALYLDPTLALVAFIGFPLGLYPIIKFGKKVRRLSRVGQNQFGGLTGTLQETIVGHRVVQAFCREDYEQARFERENESLSETFNRAEKYGALSGPTNEVLASIAIAGVILYGGLSVISGVRTQGEFIAFITAMFLLYDPLKKIGRVNNILQNGVAAAERVFELLDTEVEITERPGAVELTNRTPAIEFSQVSFRYPDHSSANVAIPLDTQLEVITSSTGVTEEHWTLKNINLTVSPGETVALVGMSGGGKSTLVNLLPRFYDVTAGKILIDGRDIRDYTLHSLRSAISVVNQHTFLFNDTILQNIAYGKPNATETEVIDAAKAANAHEFISRLPHGYQTIIGEQGFRVSGGERSRLAIARALLKNAPVLILDEATAALDSESEKLVQSAIDRLMEHRTVLVIAHRLATIRRADKIAVLVRGHVVELGGHEALLQRGGEYAKLYRIQFHDQEVGAQSREVTPPAA